MSLLPEEDPGVLCPSCAPQRRLFFLRVTSESSPHPLGGSQCCPPSLRGPRGQSPFLRRSQHCPSWGRPRRHLLPEVILPEGIPPVSSFPQGTPESFLFLQGSPALFLLIEKGPGVVPRFPDGFLPLPSPSPFSLRVTPSSLEI